MTKSVQSSNLAGQVAAPASKSMVQRAVALSSLCTQPTAITDVSDCDDLFASIRAAESLGAKVYREESTLMVSPYETEAKDTVDCGEAGLTVRMFSPIAALNPKTFDFVGSGSLLKRPLNMVEDALCGMGVRCNTSQGFLPMQITGPLKGGEYTVDGSLSSQLLTGLLIALPLAKEDSTLIVENLKSRPYVEMTLEILSDYGITIENQDFKCFTIPGGQEPKIETYSVEGDWSGASFLLVAAALAGEVTVTNLRKNSKQADKAVLEVLNMCGAKVSVEETSVTVGRSELEPFEFDATDCPDLFPPLAALAAGINGTSSIKGVHRLTHKESNRGEVLRFELARIGIRTDIEDDYLVIEGGEITGGKGDSHNDHRIAMALAVMGLVSKTGVTVEHSEAVAKSYPHFFEDLEKIGGKVI